MVAAFALVNPSTKANNIIKIIFFLLTGFPPRLLTVYGQLKFTPSSPVKSKGF
jgi:hypothetical protein